MLVIFKSKAGADIMMFEENAKQIRTLIYELPIMVIEVAHNIDDTLVDKFGLKIYTLTKNGFIEDSQPR